MNSPKPKYKLAKPGMLIRLTNQPEYEYIVVPDLRSEFGVSLYEITLGIYHRYFGCDLNDKHWTIICDSDD